MMAWFTVGFLLGIMVMALANEIRSALEGK